MGDNLLNDASAMDDTMLRDSWKGVKGAALTAFAVKAAPVIAAAVGFPPLVVVGLVGALGHFAMSWVSRKTGISWL